MDTRVVDGHVWTPDGVVEADVGIRDGVIESVGTVEAAERTVDADGCLVLPGLINAHTHAAMTLLRGYADDVPLETWLREHVWPAEAELEDRDIAAGARLAAVEMIRTGTTCFADMYFGMDEVARVVDEAGLRAVLGHGVISEGKDEEAARDDAATGVAFVREWDGAADGRIQGMITPHAPYTCDDWLLREAAEARDELGCGLQIHLSETADEVEEIVGETGERPAWYCDEMGCWDDHASAAHCVHLDSDEMRLLADRGVAAVHCPAANMKLAAGAAPVDELLAKDVTVALGTDGPASNNDLDLLGEARRAALLAKVREEDASAVDAATALEMATVNGADALDVDAGAVEVGRKGDLAVVDMAGAHTTPRHDLVSNAVYAASGSDVTATVVGGEVLMEDGEILTLDAEAVKREAADRATALVERAEAEEDGS